MSGDRDKIAHEENKKFKMILAWRGDWSDVVQPEREQSGAVFYASSSGIMHRVSAGASRSSVELRFYIPAKHKTVGKCRVFAL